MSGFVALLHPNKMPVDEALLSQMCNRLAMRAPDAQQFWRDGHVGLGHALLRTTFEAEQEVGPCTLDGNVWISADVRLDGRAELFRKLRASGREIACNCPDPEVILHAYHQWGDECLQQLSGDFAFALWDGPRQCLLCARDQFGVIPFLYTHIESTQRPLLLVSNSLTCIRLHPDVPDKLNEQAIGDFLLFGQNVELSSTFFAAIHRLPPAHALRWEKGALQIWRYWSVPEVESYLRYKNPQQYIEEFNALFSQSVADRIRSDRAAVAMSGGMDSSSVAAVASEIMAKQKPPGDLRAYTLVYQSMNEYEEGDYASLIAQHLALPIHLVPVEETQSAPFEESEPRSEPTRFVGDTTWNYIFNHCRSTYNCRILLTGFGGDQAFRADHNFWLRLLKAGHFGEIWREMRDARQIYGERPKLHLRSYFQRRQFQRRMVARFPKWLNQDFVRRLDLKARSAWWYGWPDGVRELALSPFWSNLLASGNSDDQGVPIAIRHPYFDTRLLDFLLHLPPTPWLEHKRLLREAMDRRLPQAILKRPKTPMSRAPQRNPQSIQESSADMVAFASIPELSPYVDPAIIREVATYQASTSHQFVPPLLYPAALGHWLRVSYHR